VVFQWQRAHLRGGEQGGEMGGGHGCFLVTGDW
jgi:hypothetical protein